jgi:hypothetical protein
MSRYQSSVNAQSPFESIDVINPHGITSVLFDQLNFMRLQGRWLFPWGFELNEHYIAILYIDSIGYSPVSGRAKLSAPPSMCLCNISASFL